MKSSRWRPRLAALLTALFVSVGLLGLSSLPAWATAGTITEFPVPGGDPLSITPSGSFASGFGIPTANSKPEGITVGPDGNIWFTEVSGGKIGRITTS